MVLRNVDKYRNISQMDLHLLPPFNLFAELGNLFAELGNPLPAYQKHYGKESLLALLEMKAVV